MRSAALSQRSRWPIFAPASAGVVALSLLFAARPAGAESSADRQLDEGWHAVRPHDTLEDIAEKYLGDVRRWPEIHDLNPGIDDPHWIYPGRRMRVVLERPTNKPNAKIAAVSNKVEERPAPIDWRDATPGDLLLDQDSLRTQARSSALLVFDDGTTATVSEDSLIFIRRQTSARSAAPRKEIEIQLGQADIKARQGRTPAPEIEVVVGPTRSTVRAGADGALAVRNRRQGDDANVMLFDGAGVVENENGRVDLAKGTGTVVRAGAAPRRAEKLLPAPRLQSPPAGFEFEIGRTLPALVWQPVDGAERYVVEICLDAACGRLVERSSSVEGTRYVPTTKTKAAVYWRVSAVADSGLDGFPSEARAMRPGLLISFQ